MPNETKTLKTRVINGREILMGAGWKWGPRFSNQQANSTMKLAKPN